MRDERWFVLSNSRGVTFQGWVYRVSTDAGPGVLLGKLEALYEKKLPRAADEALREGKRVGGVDGASGAKRARGS